MSLIVVGSPEFARHVTPSGHPERVERADVLDAIADRWRARGGQVREPRRATREELLRVHTAAHVDAIEATRGRASMLDPDTFTSPGSADVALLAAGAALTGLEHVLGAASAGEAGARRALVLARPPGHHAEAGKAMGFCLYNNIAVAAAAALASGLERVGLVDFDVHHGNGTQHSFYAEPRVLFISSHQYPFYPGTGAATEIGEAAGLGFTVNLPLESGCTNGDYLLAFERVVVPVLDAYRPQVVLVSAGVDAHARDPLAHMRLTADGFFRLTRLLVQVAERHAGGRVLAISEGGYELAALNDSLEAVLCALANEPGSPARDSTPAAPTGRGATAVEAVRAAQSGRWHGL